MSPLVLGEILVVFLDILTADGKYAVPYCQNSPLLIHMQLSEKRKTFSEFLVPFMEFGWNFKHFEIKSWSASLMFFRSYRLSKSWLEHSLKTAVSENALTVNTWKCPKNLWNIHGTTFIMCFYDIERSWFRKCLPYYSVKYWGCFLTYWLPMANILGKIEGICYSQFKCNYLKKEKYLTIFLFYFWNLHQISKILEKRCWS